MKKYYELNIKVLLLKDLLIKDSFMNITDFINYSFNGSRALSMLHKRIGLKHYSVSGLNPIEKEGIYKKEKIYNLRVRSFNYEFMEELNKQIRELRNNVFLVVDTVLKDISFNREIKGIINITPTVVTLEDGYYIKNKHDITNLKNAIINNLNRKYNELNNTNIKFEFEDIFKSIEFTYNYTILINYKNSQIAAHSLKLETKNNSIAQEVSQIAIVEGIGEKNSSLAAGFIGYNSKGVIK